MKALKLLLERPKQRLPQLPRGSKSQVLGQGQIKGEMTGQTRSLLLD